MYTVSNNNFDASNNNFDGNNKAIFQDGLKFDLTSKVNITDTSVVFDNTIYSSYSTYRDIRVDDRDDDTRVIKGTNKADHIQGTKANEKIWGFKENDYIHGKAGHDSIYGGKGDDDLYGGLGNDYIEGGAGRDWIYGGKGDDDLFGNQGDDDLFGEAGNDDLWGDRGDDLLDGGYGDDDLFGGKGDDRLFGGYGDDDLVGGKGDDWLDGYGAAKGWGAALGREYDTLTGGGGDDIFVLGDSKRGVSYLGAGDAVITDWDPDEDRVQVLGDASQYFLVEYDAGVGSSAKDTGLYYQGDWNQPSDLIAVFQDTTDVVIATDFNFV